MNWDKCTRNPICKTCSYYKYCKDDDNEKIKYIKRKKSKGKRKKK